MGGGRWTACPYEKPTREKSQDARKLSGELAGNQSLEKILDKDPRQTVQR